MTASLKSEEGRAFFVEVFVREVVFLVDLHEIGPLAWHSRSHWLPALASVPARARNPRTCALRP